MPEVIGCKLALKPVLRFFAPRHRCDAGVQDENVDWTALIPLRRERSNGSHTSYIQQAKSDVGMVMRSPDCGDRVVCFLLVSCGDDDAGACSCERQSGLIPDS